MTEKEIYEILAEIFQNVLDDDNLELTPELSAADVAEWDSLNHINIVVGSEVRFGVKFNTGEVEALRNVGDLVNLIANKLR